MDSDVIDETIRLDQKNEHQPVELEPDQSSDIFHQHVSSFIRDDFVAEQKQTVIDNSPDPAAAAAASGVEFESQKSLENFTTADPLILAEQEEIEWVECEEEEENYSFWWRILLAMIAITLVAAFFYFLEKRRQKQASINSKDTVNGRSNDRWENTHLNPFTMVGLDGDHLKLRIHSSDLNMPDLTLTTPGGTDHWDAELLFNYKMKLANEKRMEEHDDFEKEASPQSECILEEELVQKLILENQYIDQCQIDQVNVLSKTNELTEQTVFHDSEHLNEMNQNEVQTAKFNGHIDQAEIADKADQHIEHGQHQHALKSQSIDKSVVNGSDQGQLALNGNAVQFVHDQNQHANQLMDECAADISNDQHRSHHENDQNTSNHINEHDHIDSNISDQPIRAETETSDHQVISAENDAHHDHIDSESSDHDMISDQNEAILIKEIVNYALSEADSVHAAAVGDDYDHVTAEVQLHPDHLTADQPISDQLDMIIEPGKDVSGSPELENAEMDDSLEQDPPEVAPNEKAFDDSQPSFSQSEDQPSLAEHTTAPEIETIEVSDVEIEDADEEPQVNGPVDTVDRDSSNASKKNGSPPVICTQVKSTTPVHRRCGTTGVRLLKVETVDQKSINLINGTHNRESINGSDHADDDDEENAKMSSMFEVIGAKTVDEALIKMETLEAVTRVMRLAGLESSNLIFGIDYTASNKYQGEISFDGESLHAINQGVPNPYQQVITIMGQTLAPFAKVGSIPAYGFGDIRTSDTSIFPLKSTGYCKSFAEVLEVYNAITPKVILSGPTNFAPLIYQAIEICKEFKCYNILVIVADGQVTNERATRRAIVDACRYPLSIILVGVGDGPWEMMRVFDENLPKRPWDNFHFVEFYKVTAGAKQPDLSFAVQSLMEIPDQFKQIKALGLLNFD